MSTYDPEMPVVLSPSKTFRVCCNMICLFTHDDSKLFLQCLIGVDYDIECTEYHFKNYLKFVDGFQNYALRMAIEDTLEPVTTNQEHMYDMNHPHRGQFIIINNRNFSSETNMGERTGTDVDAANLYSRFKELGFDVTMRHNLTAASMLDVMIQGRGFIQLHQFSVASWEQSPDANNWKTKKSTVSLFMNIVTFSGSEVSSL